MTTTQMQYFLELAALKKYTVAADRLYTTQPTLSRQIKSMEDELGFKLFTHTGHTISLTAAGQAFYEGLKQIYDSYKELCQRAVSIDKGLIGELRIAILSDQLFDAPLKKAIRIFCERYPEVQIRYERLDFQQLRAALLAGTCDIGVTLLRGGNTDDRIRFFHQTSEPICITLLREQFDEMPESFTVDDVASLSGSLTGPHLKRQALEQDAGSHDNGAVAEVSHSGNSRRLDEINTFADYITTGLGYAMVNQHNTVALDPAISLVPVLDAEPVQRACCWCSLYPKPIVDNFVRICEEIDAEAE